MTIRLPRLEPGVPIVDPAAGRPTVAFVQWWGKVCTILESQESTQDGIIEELAEQLAAIVAADAKAEAAQETADEALEAEGGLSAETSLKLSYPVDISISSTDTGIEAEVTVTSHTRRYGNGDEVAVDGVVFSDAYGLLIYIHYDDPTRAGGAVSYGATLVREDAYSSAANPNRHYVGEITLTTSGGVDTFGIPGERS